MFSRIVLPALAIVAGVQAATSATSTNSACSQPTATISAAADASTLASCSTILGSVLIADSVNGAINLDGPEQIKGDLIAENAGFLTTLESTTINAIGGKFQLFNLTTLSTLNFASLTTVDSIDWSSLPALPQILFNAVLSEAKSVVITNTFLNTLNGINLQSVDTLDINNNNRLTTFSTQVGNITNSVSIFANGKSLDVAFPNLIWASNMTIRSVRSISIPSLSKINGTLGFYENDELESVSAPNLTTVGDLANGVGSFAMVGNPKLSNITIPMLKSVGGAFQIANNTGLGNFTFDSLASIGGAIYFSGNFSTPQLPKLSDVKGGFNMQSTAPIDCSGFQSAAKSGDIQGTFTCKTTADATSTTTGSGSSSSGSTTSSGASSSHTSKSAAVSYGVNEALAGISVVGGLLQMLL